MRLTRKFNINTADYEYFREDGTLATTAEVECALVNSVYEIHLGRMITHEMADEERWIMREEEREKNLGRFREETEW